MTDEALMGTQTRVVKAVAWSAINKWGGQGLSFLILWVLARLLGPEPFGLVALASAFTRFVEIFLDQGMTEAIIREPVLTDEHLNAAFLATMVWSIGLLGLTMAGAPLIAGLYREPRLSSVLRWLSVGFVLSAFSSTQMSYLRREMRFRNLALRSIFSKFVAAVVAVVLALLGFGVWSLVAQLLIMSFVGAIILWVSSDWHPKIQFSRAHFKGLFNFGIQITGSRILSFTNAQLHDFVIGYFMDATSLGFFSVAHTFTKRLVNVLRNVILDVAYPAFSRYQHQPERLRVLFDSASRFTALLIFPVYTFIFISAPELVIVLFGPEWTLAIQLTRIFALMGGIYGLVAYFSQMLMAIGQTKVLLRVKFVLLVINAAGLFLSLKYGLAVITAVYVAVWYVIMPFYYYYLHKFLNLKGYLKNFGEALAGIAAMSLAVFIARLLVVQHMPAFAVLLICCIVGFLSYGLTLLVLAPKTIRQLFTMGMAVFSQSGKKQLKTEEIL